MACTDRLSLLPVERLMLLLFLIVVCFAPGLAINCYICEDATSNDECSSEEALVDCTERFAAHDTCQTLVSKREGSDITINKQCAIGPCHLGGQQDTALGLQDCDQSKPNWNCATCCIEDACNFDMYGSGQSPLVNNRDLAYRLVLLVLVLMCKQWLSL